jgi:hypothetical protein
MMSSPLPFAPCQLPMPAADVPRALKLLTLSLLGNVAPLLQCQNLLKALLYRVSKAVPHSRLLFWPPYKFRCEILRSGHPTNKDLVFASGSQLMDLEESVVARKRSQRRSLSSCLKTRRSMVSIRAPLVGLYMKLNVAFLRTGHGRSGLPAKLKATLRRTLANCHWSDNCLHLVSVGNQELLLEVWTDPDIPNLIFRHTEQFFLKILMLRFFFFTDLLHTVKAKRKF